MSETAASIYRTEHALLVLLGQYAQQIGLIKALMAVPLHQQARTYSPQAKVLEFLVAILAGLAHLEDISRDGRPLDQDQAVAQAWQQAGWADYSGVARTLQALSQGEAEAIAQVLDEISRPILDQQVTQVLTEAIGWSTMVISPVARSQTRVRPTPAPPSATWTMRCAWATKPPWLVSAARRTGGSGCQSSRIRGICFRASAGRTGTGG